VTGKGNNSGAGGARLLPALQKALRVRGVRFVQGGGGGTLRVHVP
jgi:hypothetical protein